jgi:type IV pilus assembly protein PilV
MRTIKQSGSVLLESLMAILIFSMGILALVALLGASVRDTTSAKYRTDASMLANEIIGQMWTDDKTNAALKNNYNSTGGAKYVVWKDKVTATLPGVSNANANLPTIAIDDNNVATVTVYWKLPGESISHNYVAIASING